MKKQHAMATGEAEQKVDALLSRIHRLKEHVQRDITTLRNLCFEYERTGSKIPPEWSGTVAANSCGDKSHQANKAGKETGVSKGKGIKDNL